MPKPKKKKMPFNFSRSSKDRPKDPIDRLCTHIRQHPIEDPPDGLSENAAAIAYAMLPDLVQSVRMLKQALEEALPGVKHIACQDYEILNSAPCFANDTLFKIRAAWAEVPQKGPNETRAKT